MRFVRNPVAQFLAAALVTLTAIFLVTSRLGNAVATRQAIADARSTGLLVARSVVAPDVTPALVAGVPGARARFDRTVRPRLAPAKVRSLILWTAQGRIVYSDRHQLDGARYPLSAEQQLVLREGGTQAALVDASKPQNRYLRGPGGFLEVYTRIYAPDGRPLLVQTYFSADDVGTHGRVLFNSFWPLSLAGLLGFLAVTTPLLWVLTRRVDRSAKERERLLRAAVEASAAERRRIAADLHDGVVQDLAGTTFALSALGRDRATDSATAVQLREASRSLRVSLRALRSLLVEIYPPDLHEDSLRGALEDLVAPAVAEGVQASVTVCDLAGVSDASVALVWRVAQEAVRNALRHAQAATLRVEVRQIQARLVLEVSDDGVGMDDEASRPEDSLGLRALGDLVRDAGGELSVRSRTGQGTTVRLELSTA